MIRFDIITRSPVFFGLEERDLKELFDQIHYQVKRFEKNNLIVQAGEVCDQLMIIQQGSVKAEMADYSGKTIKIEDIESPRPLASAFLFGKKNNFPVTVSANSKVEIIVIQKPEFMKLLQLNVIILNNYLNAISTRAQFLSQRLKFLSFKTIRQKIAHFLLEEAGDKLSVVNLSRSQQELAEMFGVTRPSLARELGEMNKNGMIISQRRSIRILDKERMNQLLKT